MNEIEKMYENAGIEKQEPLFCEYFNYSAEDLYERCTRFNKYCADGHFGRKEMCPCGLSESEYEDMFKYPPFTAEKQLELIKLFAVWEISIKRILGAWYISVDGLKKNIKLKGDFSEAIAKYINVNWQDLTDKEKQQVKEILE